LSTDAMDELYGQSWPGNIRQLRTAIFRALVLARGEVVGRHDVRSALAGGATLALPGSPPVVVGSAPIATADAAPANRGASPSPEGGPLHGRPSDRSAGPVEVDGEPSRDVARRASGRAVDPSVAGPAAGEPIVNLVRPDVELEPRAILTPVSQAIDPAHAVGASGTGAAVPLTPRLLQLRSLIQERGRLTTQDHMSSSGVSHRTALRDLQALVQYGVVERVGARRGAFYRPLPVVTNPAPLDSTPGQ
jgi:hypothetical protein